MTSYYNTNPNPNVGMAIRLYASFADTTYFLLNQLISQTCQISADIAYFC